jgi:hypothetical protein
VRKLGKLPAETLTVEYALEYGSNTSRSTGTHLGGPEGVSSTTCCHRRRGAGTISSSSGSRARWWGWPSSSTRVPQGPRAAGRPPGHQRHPVLTPARRDPHAWSRERSAPSDGRAALRWLTSPRDPSRARRPAGQPTAPARPAEPMRPDPNRRRFFRQFAGDVRPRWGRSSARPSCSAGVAQAARGCSAIPGGRRRWCPARGRSSATERPPEERAAGSRFRARCAGTATCAGSSTSGGCRTSWTSGPRWRRWRRRDPRRAIVRSPAQVARRGHAR